jgi:hypothetical protein
VKSHTDGDGKRRLSGRPATSLEGRGFIGTGRTPHCGNHPGGRFTTSPESRLGLFRNSLRQIKRDSAPGASEAFAANNVGKSGGFLLHTKKIKNEGRSQYVTESKGRNCDIKWHAVMSMKINGLASFPDTLLKMQDLLGFRHLEIMQERP